MDYRIITVEKYLKSNLHKNPTIEELAQSVSLSESRLQHLFKEETGCCITDYLRNLKIEKAAELLTTTFLLIKEIRQEVGLPSAKQFLKYFKEKYDCTPREYRKKHFNTQEALQTFEDTIAESTKN